MSKLVYSLQGDDEFTYPQFRLWDDGSFYWSILYDDGWDQRGFGGPRFTKESK